MKATPEQKPAQQTRPAAELERDARSNADTLLADHRPETMSQRALIETIHTSPHMVAQRQQLRSIFGEGAQLKQEVLSSNNAGLEHEANVMGRQAVQMPSPTLSALSGNLSDLSVQRTTDAGGDPRSTAPYAKTGISPAEPLGIAHQAFSGQCEPLPHFDTIQRAFGAHDISSIQAYTGGSAAQAARSLGARGFALGNHVALGMTDLHTVAHEAAHVIQHQGGMRMKSDREDGTVESQADAVADLVVQGRSAEALLDQHSGSTTFDAAHIDLSAFEDQTKYYTYIYLLKDSEGYIRYVGKTYQKPATRKGQHDASHAERQDYVQEIADEGNWTVFETATFEQWYINRCGGTAVLDNKINGITEKKYHQYKHLHKNYCPVYG